MIKITFGDDIKTKTKKSQFGEICMIIGAVYVLTKVIIRHELDITKMKKIIEEIKSEGV